MSEATNNLKQNGRTEGSSKKTARRAAGLWLSERLLALIQSAEFELQNNNGLEHFQKKRVLDVSVASGKIVGKIQFNDSLPVRAAIAISALTSGEWNRFLQRLSEQAVFIAKFLAGDFPIELESAFRQIEKELIPTALSHVQTFCDCQRALPVCEHVAALFYQLADMLEDDPFLMLTIKGLSKDEILSELKNLRVANKKVRSLAKHSSGPKEELVESALPIDRNDFWSAGKEMFELTYNMKADDLPAALLRRVDPLPVGPAETEVEFAMEDAYVQVAKRAQGLGLGLSNNRS